MHASWQAGFDNMAWLRSDSFIRASHCFDIDNPGIQSLAYWVRALTGPAKHKIPHEAELRIVDMSFMA